MNVSITKSPTLASGEWNGYSFEIIKFGQELQCCWDDGELNVRLIPRGTDFNQLAQEWAADLTA